MKTGTGFTRNEARAAILGGTMLVYSAAVCVGFLAGGLHAEAAESSAVEAPAVKSYQEAIYISQDCNADVLMGKKYTMDDVVTGAKMLYGEALNVSDPERAATLWVVCNRLDSGDPYYAGCETIHDIITQPGQFTGYDPDNPVLPELLVLAEDVLARWSVEDCCVGNVGRVLPEEYLFFTGDGSANTFRTELAGGEVWDWSLPSPYGQEGVV